MSVYIRIYQTIGWSDKSERFMARVIAREHSKDGKPREGVSVCFYGESEEEAGEKAFAWIEDEQKRAAKKATAREAAAERLRKK